MELKLFSSLMKQVLTHVFYYLLFFFFSVSGDIFRRHMLTSKGNIYYQFTWGDLSIKACFVGVFYCCFLYIKHIKSKQLFENRRVKRKSLLGRSILAGLTFQALATLFTMIKSFSFIALVQGNSTHFFMYDLFKDVFVNILPYSFALSLVFYIGVKLMYKNNKNEEI